MAGLPAAAARVGKDTHVVVDTCAGKTIPGNVMRWVLVALHLISCANDDVVNGVVFGEGTRIAIG